MTLIVRSTCAKKYSCYLLLRSIQFQKEQFNAKDVILRSTCVVVRSTLFIVRSTHKLKSIIRSIDLQIRSIHLIVRSTNQIIWSTYCFCSCSDWKCASSAACTTASYLIVGF